jgi:ATP-dependent DNA helicase RecG
VTGASLEVRSPDYPLTALQQLVRNALMHRNYESSNAPVQVYWYADRIEIHNPGGPFGRVSVENFGQPGLTDYRNPLVAEAMKVLGYVQRFGLGLALARKELERNGNGPWEYQGNTASTLLVVRRRP